MNDYRTITLCRTFYKAIAKDLANKFKKIPPSIIHHYQTAFIKGGDIVDNINFAQEICGDFNQGKFINSFCAKIGLKKLLI